MHKCIGAHIHVSGIVQGVGFRPFIYSLAVTHHLTGSVFNTSSGVEIQVTGTVSDVDAFYTAIRTQAPPLARIDQLSRRPCPPTNAVGFEILASQPQPGAFIPISPDVSICPDCASELFDPDNRRYRYPFINCTNCGPRFSIIKDIPYDRPLTTMAGFDLCPNCASEYHNPLDRRFHAQPTACEVCGPHIWFETNGEQLSGGKSALQTARSWLQQGKILAVKGLGGFHLVCDAANPAAVKELRRRKKRSDKPFALMAYDLPTIQRHATVSPAEEQLLQSRQRPIVLLERRPESNIAPAVAPFQHTLGIMLPYTPLHLLLLEPAPGFPEVLVMTSGNLSEEPIAFEDGDAAQRLSPLADGFLLHDRPIHMRVDDSVLCSVADQPYFIRRARGYAPDSIHLPVEVPPLLATGAELKNTFCLTRAPYAFLSHHIGDLENYETLLSFEQAVPHFENLFRIKPQAIAADLHPDYLATRYAVARARAENLPLIQVQHHHAHLAACLADNDWKTDEPVIGLCFDGTGLGTDGAIWGGEVLFGGYRGYQRSFHLAYAPLAGGDLAVRKPSRMALAHLWQSGLPWDADLPSLQSFCSEEQMALTSMLVHHINSPLTSSMGRLFDAAAALIGLRQQATYEGQAAIELEAIAAPDETSFYQFDIREGVFNPTPLWLALIEQWRSGVPQSILAARFHNSIVNLCRQVCQQLRQQNGCDTVALSGGVWQNRYLLTRSISRLESDGFTVLCHRQVPTNDGGLALGQAVIAARSILG